MNECLESVVRQTFKDIEIICIDDASTDKSLDILQKYSNSDKRIKIVKHKYNKGIILARRSALKCAEGDYVAFVDADDLADHEMCEALYGRAVEKNADFVQCNAQIYDPNNILNFDLFKIYNDGISKGKNCSFSGSEIFQRYNYPIRNNLFLSFYKKNVYKKVIPFIKSDAPKRGDDDLLSFFFMFFARKYVFLDRILYKYRANETSANLNHINYDLAISQIQGRAEAVKYAKWFIKENGLEWKNDEMPFSAFTKGLVQYAASFIDRCNETKIQSKEELVRIFGDCFGGDALLYFIKKIDDKDFLFYRNDYLLQELKAVYSSHSWKMTKPLRWGKRILRKLF